MPEIRETINRISQGVVEETLQNAAKIDTIDYGRVIFVVKGGRVVRVILEDAWLAGDRPETE